MSTPEGKVLLFCPTYYKENGELALRKRTRECIDALEWDGELDIEISTLNPYKIADDVGYHRRDQLENVLIQFRKGWAMCLKGGYDAILTVEHDMVIPADALRKLWAVDKPVVYGVYMLRHGPPRISAWRPIRSPNVGMALDIFPNELEIARKKVVAEVSGVGWGCTLIRREIVEKFPLHRSNDGHPSPDVPFATDLQAAGIQQYAHFGVVCGHILPTGEVLWPPWGEEEGIHVSVKTMYVAIQSFNGQVGNNLMHFNAGDEYELSELDAAPFVRAGFLMGGAVTEKEVVEPPEKEQVQAKVSSRKKQVAKPLNKKSLKGDDDEEGE